ncbi:MAG: rod shape-determining protein MreD [Bacteroidales bacterium]|nr:rod shape-determining protein MreD [Bacteroidales bacterium]MBR5533095.1 rod shape-determining protein MreD [Bacteroidales bacterium]
MKRLSVAYYIVLAFALILLQVTIFSNIALWGVATPFLFIYLIMKLPVSVSPNKVMTIAFFVGLTIDIFFSTPGVYSLSSVITAFMRKPFITLVLQHEDDYGTMYPSIKSLGIAPFTVFALITSLTFTSAVFIIQSFSLYNPLYLVLKIATSTLFTYILIMAAEYILKERR